MTRRRRVSARRRRAHGLAICGFSLITQKLRHFYFRHVVFFHSLGVISFDFKHFEKKNWNRLKKKILSRKSHCLFPTGNFQAAITSEPIDVGTSDQVFWTFQATHNTMAPKKISIFEKFSWIEIFYAIVLWVAWNVHKTWSEVSASIGSIFIAIWKSPL